jgi:hypothetical protein
VLLYAESIDDSMDKIEYSSACNSAFEMIGLIDRASKITNTGVTRIDNTYDGVEDE